MDLTDLINIDEVALHTNTTPRTVYRYMESRNFPKPVRFGSAVFWRETEVLEWVTENRKPSQNTTRQREEAVV